MDLPCCKIRLGFVTFPAGSTVYIKDAGAYPIKSAGRGLLLPYPLRATGLHI
jgi:hypothetical protein